MNAVIAYMLADWYRPNVTLDFPKGGSGAIAEALIRGIKKNNGNVYLRKHVTNVLTSSDASEATGVLFRNERTGQDQQLLARVAVVSNVDPYKTRQLVPIGVSAKFDEAMKTMTVRNSNYSYLIFYLFPHEKH